MIASEDDARLLFGRWKEDAPPLRVKLISNSLVFEATGTVGDFTHGTLQLNGPAWQFTIPLTGAEFTFSDPREIPVAAVRDVETSRYEFGLSLAMPSGDRLVLMEIKREPDEPVDDDETAEA